MSVVIERMREAYDNAGADEGFATLSKRQQNHKRMNAARIAHLSALADPAAVTDAMAEEACKEFWGGYGGEGNPTAWNNMLLPDDDGEDRKALISYMRNALTAAFLAASKE